MINANLKGYLQIGTLFWVYGIRCCSNVTYLYIFNGNHLFEAPIDFFEIIDNRISKEWLIKSWRNGEITFWPDLFFREGFLENFAERELLERNLFGSLKERIEQDL